MTTLQVIFISNIRRSSSVLGSAAGGSAVPSLAEITMKKMLNIRRTKKKVRTPN